MGIARTKKLAPTIIDPTSSQLRPIISASIELMDPCNVLQADSLPALKEIRPDVSLNAI